MLSFRPQRCLEVNAFGCMLWALGASLGTQSLGHAKTAQRAEMHAATRQVEEIYIARSVRESRIAPTGFCAQARTGFGDVAFEDQYTFRSTATRADDGLMLDSNIKTIGSIHACFGRTAHSELLNFYGELLLGRTAFSGIGECRRAKSDFPERGLTVLTCFLDLSGLPEPYVGGLLTTNTMNSLRNLGRETDPGGYTQTSIATIRLWRKRAKH
jgi:hypothetical protein